MILLYILLSLVALIVIGIMGAMLFDVAGKHLARFVEWFIRKF